MTAYPSAWQAYQAGDFAAAGALLREALDQGPETFEDLNLLSVVEANQGRSEAALAANTRALALKPANLQALQNRGVFLQALQDHEAAIEAYQAVLAAQPGQAEALGNLALSLLTLGRYDAALTRYDQAIAVAPEFFAAHNGRGVTLSHLGRDAESLAAYDAALALSPDDALTLANHANALMALGRLDEALAGFDAAVAIQPAVDSLINRGVALHRLRRYDEALESHERALALSPGHPGALKNRGVALSQLRLYDQALVCYDQVLAAKPGDLETLYNRGVAFEALKRPAEALACYDQVLAVLPHHVDALNNRGAALQSMRRFGEALAAFEAALAAGQAAGRTGAMGLSGAASAALRLCDWDRQDRYAAALNEQVATENSVVVPFMMLSYGAPAALQLKAARTYVRDMFPVPPPPLWTGPARPKDKLRVAYLTADWRPHPMGYLTVGVFGLHDRSRFEVVGLGFGPPDDSWVRRRVIEGLDAFHDIGGMTDAEAAQLLYSLDVDIAVDLMGHTEDSRPGILARRPAPIQVNWLGCPATMGADFIDYVLADPIVLPKDEQALYAETIIHLPGCYQSNDNRRPVSAVQATRAQLGLPEQGFVFCCFNNAWKISRDFFDVWMRLLRATPGSVLWLLSDSPEAEAALRGHATDRGVDPARLVFASHLIVEDHIARHRQADLFLDTLPYNAHTTGSDALWAGLPIVTAKGNTFAGRVAASLLTNVGLPELITETLEDYEALALALATDPERLAKLRAKLARVRDTSALFDTPRFTRGLEAAFEQMLNSGTGTQFASAAGSARTDRGAN